MNKQSQPSTFRQSSDQVEIFAQLMREQNSGVAASPISKKGQESKGQAPKANKRHKA